jgi:cytochrome c oxidase subunit II
MPSGLFFFAVAFASALLFVFRPAWFPLSIDAAARAWDREFSITLIAAGTIFLGVHLLLAWSVFRARKQNTRAAAGGTRRGNWRIEVLWTSVTAVLFLGLAAFGSAGWARIPEPAPGEEKIEVYARQFAWSFRYPGPDRIFGRTAHNFISDSGGNPIGLDPADPDGRDDIVSATLHIPVGRKVLLLLHSRDVIHDFFVRELRTKQDIVPGMEISLEIRIDRPGQYEIACAELCGLGHSQMHSFLIALPPAEYEQWKRAH